MSSIGTSKRPSELPTPKQINSFYTSISILFMDVVMLYGIFQHI